MSKNGRKRWLRRTKKNARKARQEVRKAKNLQLKQGVGHLYFLNLGENLFGFSVSPRDTVYIRDLETLKVCLFGNVPIKNMDTGEIYPNFEDYRKEKLIIKLAGI